MLDPYHVAVAMVDLQDDQKTYRYGCVTIVNLDALVFSEKPEERAWAVAIIHDLEDSISGCRRKVYLDELKPPEMRPESCIWRLSWDVLNDVAIQTPTAVMAVASVVYIDEVPE
jgi:hypothetical protein